MPQYHVITLITVKDLNNDDPDGYYGSLKAGYNWLHLVTSGHTWSQFVKLVMSMTSTMLTLLVIMALCNLARRSHMVTAGHNWSQVVTLVTVMVKDINNGVLDGNFAP